MRIFTARQRGTALPSVDSIAVAAVVISFAALVLPPLAFLIVGSFRTAGPGAPDAAFTWDNWIAALDPRSLKALSNSLLVGVSTAIIAVMLGVVLAWLLVRTDMPGRPKFSSLVIIPLLFSPLLTSIAWVGLAGPNAGLLNVLLRQFAGDAAPRLNIYSFGGMILILTLHYAPYAYLAVRAALLNVDPNYEDAARVLGARFGTVIRTITLPLVAPAVLAAGMLILVLAAEEFAVPSIIGSGFGFRTLPMEIYDAMAVFPAAPTRGTALALVLVLIMIAGMIVYFRTLRASSRFVTISGKGMPVSPTRLLPFARGVAVLFVGLFLFLGVLLPYATLLLGSFSSYFATSNFDVRMLTTSHYTDAFQSSQFRVGLWNTAILVGIGATVIALVGALASWISIRSRSSLRWVINYLGAVPLMIPGIAIGIGMLWAWTSIPTGLYGTIGILLVAFFVRFIGHAMRISSPSILQLSAELEEAAYTLGSSRLRTFRTVTLPLLRSALGAAWVVVAVFISLEISSSIFLYTGQSQSLAVYVWQTIHSQSVSTAFAAASLLATFAFVVIAVAQSRFRVLERL